MKAIAWAASGQRVFSKTETPQAQASREEPSGWEGREQGTVAGTHPASLSGHASSQSTNGLPRGQQEQGVVRLPTAALLCRKGSVLRALGEAPSELGILRPAKLSLKCG